MKLVYLGPPGTFGSEAAFLYAPEADLVWVTKNEEVIRTVQHEEADTGIVPIENSVEGAVTAVVDEFIHNSRGVSIVGELYLPIVQCLIAPVGMSSHADAQIVFSHPQALAQCGMWLERWMPLAAKLPALSTTDAVERAMRERAPAVAIAPRRAAELYEYTKVLVHGIQDHSNNTTRFVIVGRHETLPTGEDKTSLCFIPGGDQPGTLASILQEFGNRDINLSKIESRPTKKRIGSYVFLVDLDGHQNDPIVREALESVQRQVSLLKVFGSYPRVQ